MGGERLMEGGKSELAHFTGISLVIIMVRRSLKGPERKWQPTPVSLPGESCGWGSLAGYSPWRHKELDTT